MPLVARLAYKRATQRLNKSLIDNFTKKETMELAGVTSNQLQYLERSELIKPIRGWDGKKKTDIYYSWQQILEISLN